MTSDEPAEDLTAEEFDRLLAASTPVEPIVDLGLNDLIERSSLGTPGAKALRARTTDAEVERVRARVRALRAKEPPRRAEEEDGDHDDQ